MYTKQTLSGKLAVLEMQAIHRQAMIGQQCVLFFQGSLG